MALLVESVRARPEKGPQPSGPFTAHSWPLIKLDKNMYKLSPILFEPSPQLN
uniref:Uncharacterized protein n=1 Tax=Arundo donax TaxID=35708 RepID=A0A0A8Z7E7_ARUDO